MTNSQKLAVGIRKSLAEGLTDGSLYFLTDSIWGFSQHAVNIIGGCAVTLAVHGMTGLSLVELQKQTSPSDTLTIYSNLINVSRILLDNIETLHCIYHLKAEVIADMLDAGEISETEDLSFYECERLTNDKTQRRDA